MQQAAAQTAAEIVAGYVHRYGTLADAISAAGVYYDREGLDLLLAEKSRQEQATAPLSLQAAE